MTERASGSGFIVIVGTLVSLIVGFLVNQTFPLGVAVAATLALWSILLAIALVAWNQENSQAIRNESVDLTE